MAGARAEQALGWLVAASADVGPAWNAQGIYASPVAGRVPRSAAPLLLHSHCVGRADVTARGADRSKLHLRTCAVPRCARAVALVFAVALVAALASLPCCLYACIHASARRQAAGGPSSGPSPRAAAGRTPSPAPAAAAAARPPLHRTRQRA